MREGVAEGDDRWLSVDRPPVAGSRPPGSCSVRPPDSRPAPPGGRDARPTKTRKRTWTDDVGALHPVPCRADTPAGRAAARPLRAPFRFKHPSGTGFALSAGRPSWNGRPGRPASSVRCRRTVVVHRAEVQLAGIAPRPRLAALGGAGHRMTCGLMVSGGVRAGRTVAASEVTAVQADEEPYPRLLPSRDALRAPFALASLRGSGRRVGVRAVPALGAAAVGSRHPSGHAVSLLDAVDVLPWTARLGAGPVSGRFGDGGRERSVTVRARHVRGRRPARRSRKRT